MKKRVSSILLAAVLCVTMLSVVPLSAYPNPTLCGERYSFKPKDTPYLNR